MREYVLWGGFALCLVTLWVIARHDWIRLTRPRRNVLAQVTGYRLVSENDSRSWAAIYTFEAEGARHEVADQVTHGVPREAKGEVVALVYPAGRPDLARPPRPLMWGLIYLLLLGLAAMLGVEALWPGTLPRS